MMNEEEMQLTVQDRGVATRRFRSRKKLTSGLAMLGLTLGILSVPTSASAYALTGCHWRATSLTINIAYTNGLSRSGIVLAANNYSQSTHLGLYTTDASGPSFTAQNTNYGATGWEGYTTWTCFLSNTSSAVAKVNDYYLSGAPASQLKVVWLHELGHGVGLDHVNSIYRVMNPSASQSYFDGGVRSLTSDEINGVNSLY